MHYKQRYVILKIAHRVLVIRGTQSLSPFWDLEKFQRQSLVVRENRVYLAKLLFFLHVNNQQINKYVKIYTYLVGCVLRTRIIGVHTSLTSQHFVVFSNREMNSTTATTGRLLSRQSTNSIQLRLRQNPGANNLLKR